MSRFIPEANINNPKKMLHYIQYFVWYQMITGIMQTTIVSVYAIFYASRTDLAYMVWIMLICSTTQYPGMLGLFSNLLIALQHFDKSKLLGFLTGTTMQQIISLLFAYFGRIYGENNPQIGAVLGLAIGAAIGSYIDDFIAVLFGAYFVSDVIEPYGIKIRHCFYVDFTWEEIKPVLYYSLRIGIPGIILGMISFSTWQMQITSIPQIVSIIFLSDVGYSIGNAWGWMGHTDIGPLLNEAYMNDRKKLAQYYVAQEIRMDFFVIGIFFPIILIIAEIMPNLWEPLGMKAYSGAGIFIIPSLISGAIERFYDVPGQILNGAARPNFGIFMSYIAAGLDFLIKYLIYVKYNVGSNLDLNGLAWLLRFWMVTPVPLFSTIITYIYIHKKILPLKIPGKQLFFGAVIPTALSFVYYKLIKIFVYDTLLSGGRFYGALFVSIACILLGVLLIFSPLTGFFGFWDKDNLEDLHKSTKMAGPSVFIVKPIAWIVTKACRISPFFNKFGLSKDDLIQDVLDLYSEKKGNRAILKEELQKT